MFRPVLVGLLVLLATGCVIAGEDRVPRLPDGPVPDAGALQPDGRPAPDGADVDAGS